MYKGSLSCSIMKHTIVASCTAQATLNGKVALCLSLQIEFFKEINSCKKEKCITNYSKWFIYQADRHRKGSCISSPNVTTDALGSPLIRFDPQPVNSRRRTYTGKRTVTSNECTSDNFFHVCGTPHRCCQLPRAPFEQPFQIHPGVLQDPILRISPYRAHIQTSCQLVSIT